MYTHTDTRFIHTCIYIAFVLSIVDEKRTVLSYRNVFFFFCQFSVLFFFPSRYITLLQQLVLYIYIFISTFVCTDPACQPTRDRNSFPSISIFSPASGALMKNDSDARHYSSALSSVIGSFFPRARARSLVHAKNPIYQRQIFLFLELPSPPSPSSPYHCATAFSPPPPPPFPSDDRAQSPRVPPRVKTRTFKFS